MRWFTCVLIFLAFFSRYDSRFWYQYVGIQNATEKKKRKKQEKRKKNARKTQEKRKKNARKMREKL